MRFQNHKALFHRGLYVVILSLGIGIARADDSFTREYWLKHTDVPLISRTLNVLMGNRPGRRIIGGQGKHLVVTAPPDQQDEVADLLTILDKPLTQTNPDKQFMELIQGGLRYLKQQQVDVATLQKNEASSSSSPASAETRGTVSGTNTYVTYKSTRSIYAASDAKLLQQQHRIVEEPLLPSVNDLDLKGIFKPAQEPPMALLSYGNTLFTARDGGLFERNRTRLKGVTSEVQKDKVILTGPDRRPREFKFKSTL
jgi:hypothetical protein